MESFLPCSDGFGEPGLTGRCDVLDRIRYRKNGGSIPAFEAGVVVLALAVIVSQIVIALA